MKRWGLGIVIAALGLGLIFWGASFYKEYSHRRALQAQSELKMAQTLARQKRAGQLLKRHTAAGLNAVRNSLIDPSSAQFDSVVVWRIADIPLVCGNVNSKNTYGGYVGRRTFWVMLGPDSKPYRVRIAGQDWRPCEFCRKWDDYFAEDTVNTAEMCSGKERF